MSNDFTMILGILAGVFSIAGAIFDWDWFMNHHRARFFVNLFGRGGARMFYVVLGCLIIALSVTSGGFSR